MVRRCAASRIDGRLIAHPRSKSGSRTWSGRGHVAPKDVPSHRRQAVGQGDAGGAHGAGLGMLSPERPCKPSQLGQGVGRAGRRTALLVAFSAAAGLGWRRSAMRRRTVFCRRDRRKGLQDLIWSCSMSEMDLPAYLVSARNDVGRARRRRPIEQDQSNKWPCSVTHRAGPCQIRI